MTVVIDKETLRQTGGRRHVDAAKCDELINLKANIQRPRESASSSAIP